MTVQYRVIAQVMIWISSLFKYPFLTI